MRSGWTRAPIEDGVDGAGVYASRLRPRRLARSPQSPEVLGPGGAHARREIGWGRKIAQRSVMAYGLGVAVSRWTVAVCLWRIEETPSTWRRARSFAEKGAGETWRLGHQKRDLAGFG